MLCKSDTPLSIIADLNLLDLATALLLFYERSESSRPLIEAPDIEAFRRARRRIHEDANRKRKERATKIAAGEAGARKLAVSNETATRAWDLHLHGAQACLQRCMLPWNCASSLTATSFSIWLR